MDNTQSTNRLWNSSGAAMKRGVDRRVRFWRRIIYQARFAVNAKMRSRMMRSLKKIFSVGVYTYNKELSTKAEKKDANY